MTQEDKELLFKDLCARLPYEPICKENEYKPSFAICSYEAENTFIDTEGWTYNIKNIKPYLRPMSSMTEEEAKEYANCGNVIAFSSQKDYLIPNPNSTDWLNAHHFDYRGLIEKGLAIGT